MRSATEGRPRVAAVLLTCCAVVCLGACAADPVQDGPTPLWSYLAQFSERGTAEAERIRVAQTDQVAACMHAAGFEFAPVPDDLWQTQVMASPPRDDDWVEQHGYGLTEGASTTTVEHTPSPNDAIVEALSPAEREAYDLALTGPDGTGGCVGDATTSEPAWFDDPTYRELLEQATALGEQAEKDPAVVSAVATWRECMAEAGQPGYDDPADAQLQLGDRVSDAEVNGPGTVPAGRRAELLAAEVAVAVADRRCTASSGIEAVRTAAVTVLEQEYVDEHRAELDAWLPAAQR